MGEYRVNDTLMPLFIGDGIELWVDNDGRIHRDDGPAIIRQDGSKEWWCKGKRHRIDGPAIEYPNGRVSWFINDRRIRNEYNFRRYSKVTNEVMVMILLKYGNIG